MVSLKWRRKPNKAERAKRFASFVCLRRKADDICARLVTVASFSTEKLTHLGS